MTADQRSIAIARASPSSIAWALANAESLLDGLLVHEHITRHGTTAAERETEGEGEREWGSRRNAASSSSSSSSLEISLLQMYSGYGASQEAWCCFDRVPSRGAFEWTCIIKAHLHSKDSALGHFHQMQAEGVPPSKFASIALLSAFSGKQALMDAKHVHTRILGAGLERDAFVATAVLTAYGKCSSICDAASAFDSMVGRDVVAWNAMLSAYAEAELHQEAFQHFEAMRRRPGIRPSRATFLGVLESCRSLERGKCIHGLVLSSDLGEDLSVANSLINMYSKCGSACDARLVFDRMLRRDAISWNTMIAAYVQAERHEEASSLLDQMRAESIAMDKVTFVTMLASCAGEDRSALDLAKKLHRGAVCCGFDLDAVVGAALITAYARDVGAVSEARDVFDRLEGHDVVVWNAMISAYGQHGLCRDAVQLFDLMLSNRTVSPDRATFVCLLDACIVTIDGNAGGSEWVFDLVRGSDLGKDLVVGTAMVRAYAECGNLDEARSVFDSLADKDVVLWNTMISGYGARSKGRGSSDSALQHLYHRMTEEATMPNRITIANMLNVCAGEEGAARLAEGKQLHARFDPSVIEADAVVASALVNMYGKCGHVESACRCFGLMQERDAVAWTTMIAVHAQQGRPREAMESFKRMQEEGSMPDVVTAIAAVSACCMSSIGKQIHAPRVLDSSDRTDTVLGNTLVSMYGRCGCLDRALSSFGEMQERDAVSFLSAISACASHAALSRGREVHSLLVESGFGCGEAARNALVSLYGKCGAIADARRSLDSASEGCVAAWNAMMAAYSWAGDAENASRLLQQMHENEIKPDDSTFVSLLTACNHAGLVEGGFQTFLLIGPSPPILDHYNCLLDLLARAGQLDAAEGLIEAMPLEASTVSWTSLLCACKAEADMLRGQRAASNALRLDPADPSLHVLLSNLYAACFRVRDDEDDDDDDDDDDDADADADADADDDVSSARSCV